MLSNYIVGQHKFVLFVDEVGIERSSKKILEKLLGEQNVSYDSFSEDHKFTEKTAVVLEPISKLELNQDESSIASTIQSLKLDKNVSQVFGWATTKNIHSRLLLPFLEHMSDIVVTLKSESYLSILTKRKFGSVKLKDYQHELTKGKTSVKEFKAEKQKVIQDEPTINPESIGTFKIGEFNSSELEARKNLKLPFEIM
jgi:hypothetical protein